MTLSCKNIIKNYDGKVVLDLEQLEIPRASFFGIVGYNGAGKSTLLHIIGGLDQEFSGKVDYFSDFSLATDCTLVLQSAYLFRGSVEDNIEYPLKLRKVAKAERIARVEELLEEFDLAALRHQSAATLSGGERQRTALARALSFNPRLVLLDEPTANIDPVSTRLMEEILLKEWAKGTTLVLITHNLAQANRLCSHISFFKDARCLEIVSGECAFDQAQTQEFKDYIAGEIL